MSHRSDDPVSVPLSRKRQALVLCRGRLDNRAGPERCFPGLRLCFVFRLWGRRYSNMKNNITPVRPYLEVGTRRTAAL
eukprot:1559482-Pyramimonas_sp.AAC.1